MQFLRANTQVKVVVGPVVAVGDGFTPVTTLAVSSADEAEIMKHDASSVTDISAATFAAITSMDGYYNLTLTTSHTDTEGLLTVGINDDSLCLPVKQTFMVLAEAAWDSMFVAKDDGFMDVNIKTVGRADTQETEATNLEAACAAYSATRGLSGTALPAAAADGSGGLPISDAGGLDLDAKIGALTYGTANRVNVQVYGMEANAIAEINATVDTAFADYDPPTYAELLNFIRIICRKDAAIAVDLASYVTAINVDMGSGGGAYVSTTDTLEALRDRGDAAWITATGFSTHSAADVWAVGTRRVSDATNITSTGGTTVPQTGDSFARIGAAGASLTDLGGMSTTMKAQVNAEVVDTLATDTYAEPGQGTPSATLSLAAKINYMFKSWRNKKTQTSTTWSLFADDTTTVDQKATVSDDATTATKGEIATGP